MIPNRAPSTMWCLSRTNLDTHVRTGPNDHVVLVGPDAVGYVTAIHLSRKDARLLAKRINQCLDDTAKR